MGSVDRIIITITGKSYDIYSLLFWCGKEFRNVDNDFSYSPVLYLIIKNTITHNAQLNLPLRFSLYARALVKLSFLLGTQHRSKT